MADTDDYLEEGFDPRNVTMPRLRSILVTHNIEYPATAKKAQLVQLVEDQVLSQAPKLRAQKARAKRSSMGIVNAGSAEDDVRWAENDPETPATVRRSKTPRKSSSKLIKPEQDEADATVLRNPVKRNARSTSREVPSYADGTAAGELEVPKSVRRPRRTITPQIKDEPVEDDISFPEEEESVFTDDNPFQSGSSPPQTKTPSSRRRTGDGDLLKSIKSTTRPKDAIVKRPKTPKLFDVSTSDPALEPGEEFTPDEQLELEDAARRGEVALAPRKKTRSSSRRSGVGTPLMVLLTTLLGAYLAWYRQEKIAVGYCGLGRPSKDIIPHEISIPDTLVPFIEPQCEQCPQHAYCYQDFSVRCESDFVLQPHPLSFGGLVPLPPTCEPDGEKVRKVHSVADKAIEELRERRAKFECGELIDEQGNHADSPSIAETELKATVSAKRSKRLNSDEFEELWAAAIGEVTAREEVQVQTEASDTPHFPVGKLSSTSLARLPLRCAVKRSIKLGLARYRLAIGLLASVVCMAFYTRARYQRHVVTSAQIPALVDAIMARLANQKELGDEDIDDPWIFLPNLRDDILRAVHSLSERERIWQRVRAVVEQNSNVRTSQREGRSGEVGRAWEWIGPVAGEGARRRRSGRVSFGPRSTSSSPEGSGTAEMKKWEEPRPIY